MHSWPELRYGDWADTAATLHMWTQIVGKIRMAKAPAVNHWWHVTLYVTSRGLTTSPIPFDDGRLFEMEFDFTDHQLSVSTSAGQNAVFPLEPMSVAEFYRRLMALMSDLDILVEINKTPSEVSDPVDFDKDTRHASYDAAAASRFWRVLVDATRVFSQFRGEFIGKVSPVHFFWGAPDLAITRFSGREAPAHGPVPNLPLHVVQEAYSHEVSSVGFWPGAPGVEPIFYAYAYPEPPGFADATVQPAEAAYSRELGEFVLPYDAVRNSPSPDETLMQFLRTTYAAAADLAQWDRTALERR